MPTISKDRIIFDVNDWLAGMHPQASVGTPFVLRGHDTAIAFDPLRFLGFASPGELPEDATDVSVVDGVLKRIIFVDSTSKGYAVGGGKVHEINSTTSALTNDGDFPHTIDHGHASEAVEDIIQYTIAGVDYAFYSFNDATDGDVGRLVISTDVFDDDFMSTVPATAAVLGINPHPMIVGDDDILYIGDGNVLKAYDGPNDTFTPSGAGTLTIPNKMTIRSMSKLGNDTLVVFASTNTTNTTKAGTVRAYFWRYGEPDPYKVKKVMGSKCGGAFEYKGSVGCWTIGITADPAENTKTVHLSIFDGTEFKHINSIEETEVPLHGGVEVEASTIYANSGGNLYTYGSPYRGIGSGIQKINNGGGTTSGAVKTLFTGRRLISSGTTTSGGLEILSGNYTTSATLQTSFGFPDFERNMKGKATDVRIDWKGTTTGGRALSVDILNESGTNIAQVTNGLEDVANISENFKLATDGTEFEPFLGCQLSLTWATGTDGTDAPIPRKITVYYEQQEL